MRSFITLVLLCVFAVGCSTTADEKRKTEISEIQNENRQEAQQAPLQRVSSAEKSKVDAEFLKDYNPDAKKIEKSKSSSEGLEADSGYKKSQKGLGYETTAGYGSNPRAETNDEKDKRWRRDQGVNIPIPGSPISIPITNGN